MFRFVPVASNTKTGPIPITYSERATCPTTCPFYHKGCYAKYGNTLIQWRKTETSSNDWATLCHNISNLPKGQIWRHNVAGDLPHNRGFINFFLLKNLIVANNNKRGFTYTHHLLNNHNVKVIKKSNSLGFTINASTESVEVADKIMTEYGIPAVSVIKSDETRRFYYTESGRKVVVCPAVLNDNITCSNCGLCQVADRNCIVGFPAHGVAKKSVNEIIG